MTGRGVDGCSVALCWIRLFWGGLRPRGGGGESGNLPIKALSGKLGIGHEYTYCDGFWLSASSVSFFDKQQYAGLARKIIGPRALLTNKLWLH